jgi:hypothetical protein
MRILSDINHVFLRCKLFWPVLAIQSSLSNTTIEFGYWFNVLAMCADGRTIESDYGHIFLLCFQL